MSILESLRTRYRDRALAADTLFLLSPGDALKFLEEAHSAGLILAGIEGFLVTDTGAYQPRQDFSNDAADFSGSKDQFVESTRNLIRQGTRIGIRFQVVIQEPAS